MPDLILLLVKAGLAACVVVAATMAAERVGPFWGALITSLPVSIGPIYVVMAIDHSAAFISLSALSSLATNAATLVFLMVAALAATRTSPAAAVILAIGSWAGSAALIHLSQWSVITAVLLNGSAVAVALLVTRVWARPGHAAPTPGRWFDLPLRALMVGILTVIVAVSSTALGPTYSGILAITPVVFISATIVLLLRLGGPATAATLTRAILPIAGFGLALVTVHIVTARYGAALGLSLGLATSLGFSTILAVLHLGRRAHP